MKNEIEKQSRKVYSHVNAMRNQEGLWLDI